MSQTKKIGDRPFHVFIGTSVETQATCNRPRVTFEKLPVVIEESQSENGDREVSHPYKEKPPRQSSPPIATHEQIDKNDSDWKLTDYNRPRVRPENVRERLETLAKRDVDDSDVPAGRSRCPSFRFGVEKYVSKSKYLSDFGRLSCERSRPSSTNFFCVPLSTNVIIYKIKHDCFSIEFLSHK